MTIPLKPETTTGGAPKHPHTLDELWVILVVVPLSPRSLRPAWGVCLRPAVQTTVYNRVAQLPFNVAATPNSYTRPAPSVLGTTVEQNNNNNKQPNTQFFFFKSLITIIIYLFHCTPVPFWLQEQHIADKPLFDGGILGTRAVFLNTN